MPRGVWIHLSSTARLTVVTCTPTVSAICCIFSGTMNSGPSSRNRFWWSTIACDTRVSVLRRCSIESISHWAALIFRLMNSRSSVRGLAADQAPAIVVADEQAWRAGRLPATTR